jgi:hypothetical protein
MFVFTSGSVGGYLLGPRRPIRMERQAATIKKDLTRWREQGPASG